MGPLDASGLTERGLVRAAGWSNGIRRAHGHSRGEMTMTKSMLQLAMLIGVITAVLGFTTDAHADGWSPDVRITSIEVSNVHVLGVWLLFSTPPHTPSCPLTTSYYILGGGTTNIDRMFSLATEALLNSRTVSVYWGGDCSADGYPVLRGIMLK
jgi:hypothetical protein